MAVGYLDLFVSQGQDFSATISLDNFNKTNFDLTDYTARSDIRRSYWSEDTSASFDTTIDANNGVILIQLDANTTQSLTHTKYVYDLFVKNESSGERSKVLEGAVFIDLSATKI